MTQKQHLAVVVLAAACLAPLAVGQATESKAPKRGPEQVQTFFLKNATGSMDLNDEQTALRNMLPGARFYGSTATRAITVNGTEEELRTVKEVLADLDRPRKSYRVTYTISDVENGKRGAAQHYSLVVVGSTSSEFRQGNRVPILTGKTGDEKGPDTQFQYVDVGINISCTAEASALHSKIELSGVADEKSNVGIQNPIIRQTRLEGFSLFTPGKPQVIGTIEVPGTNHKQEIEVLVEPL
jgi:type II secretory pathway component GspD/PulD (secretin)